MTKNPGNSGVFMFSRRHPTCVGRGGIADQSMQVQDEIFDGAIDLDKSYMLVETRLLEFDLLEFDGIVESVKDPGIPGIYR